MAQNISRSFLENKGKGKVFLIGGEFCAEVDDETYARERDDDPESSNFDSTRR